MDFIGTSRKCRDVCFWFAASALLASSSAFAQDSSLAAREKARAELQQGIDRVNAESEAKIVPLHMLKPDEMSVHFVGTSQQNVLVTVQKRVRRPISIVVTPGTVFTSYNAKRQAMAAIGTIEQPVHLQAQPPMHSYLVLDNEPHSFIVPCLCMNHDKDGTPGAKDGFMPIVVNADAKRIIEGSGEVHSWRPTQEAIWRFFSPGYRQKAPPPIPPQTNQRKQTLAREK